jgi:tetratricopeptide (TPR) repeat protein
MGANVTHLNFRSGFILLIVSLFNGIFAVIPAFAQAGNPACGSLANAFGPFDYRTERGNSLYLVESTHFLPYIETLIRGNSSTTPGGDIDYTLRAFPNHHRALMAMMHLGEKEKTPKPIGSHYTVECWFQRAVQFRPDDTTVRMIFSSYLSKNKRVPEAVNQLEQATGLAKDNAFTHYNIGLVYFDMKIYDKALVQAHRALALGFERTELRDLLEKAGQWQGPTIAPTMNPANTPASAPKPEQ